MKTLSAIFKMSKNLQKDLPFVRFFPMIVEPAIAQDAAIAEFSPRIHYEQCGLDYLT